MTEFDWDTTRTKAIRRLGQTPGAQLEADLIEAFKDEPRHITQIIEAVIAERDAGAKMDNPWAIIRYRANQHHEPVPATDSNERGAAIKRAEQWTRVAGLFLPLPEYERVLFSTVELTPTLDQLLQIELSTRDRPGRHYYGDLLVASIKETDANGPQEVPGTRGVLNDYETPELRQRMRLLHAEYQGRALATEREHEQRAQERAAIRNPPPEREPPF